MKQWLLCLALLGASCVAPAQTTYQQKPGDDIWVYTNAADAAFDPILRIWGTGTSVGTGTPPGGEWSYGYLKWNLSAIPKLAPGQYYQVTEARLTVTSQRATTYSLAEAQAHPLEARPLGSDFSELTWDYDDPNNPAPGDTRFGIGDLSNFSTAATFTIPIDLLTGPGDFSAHFNAVINRAGELGLALTSDMPAVQQGGKFYRIYSKDDPGNRGPMLKLAYHAVCELSGVITLEDTANAAQAITLEFRPDDNTAPFVKKITLEDDGAFVVRDIPLKTYQVAIKGAKWLQKTVSVDATLAPVTPITAVLLAGDANKDNSVDVLDLSILIEAFDATPTSSNWIAGADFNCDDSVDVFDLDLLIRNFDLTGDA